MKKYRWITLLVLAMSALFLFAGCKGKDSEKKENNGSATQRTEKEDASQQSSQEEIELPQDELLDPDSADAGPEGSNEAPGTSSSSNGSVGISGSNNGSAGTSGNSNSSAGTSGSSNESSGTSGDNGEQGEGTTEKETSRDPIVLPEIDLD